MTLSDTIPLVLQTTIRPEIERALMGLRDEEALSDWGIRDWVVQSFNDLMSDDSIVVITLKYWHIEDDRPGEIGLEAARLTHEAKMDGKVADVFQYHLNTIANCLKKKVVALFELMSEARKPIDWRPSEMIPEDYYAF